MTGEELRKLRARNEWSQADLAAAINAALGRSYSSGSISPWETGRRNIPADVAVFLEELTVSTSLPPGANDEPTPLAGNLDGDAAADLPPWDGSDIPPAQPALGGSGTWARACTELWELIASGVGMMGAATGSPTLMQDGAIIAGDARALGEAWGKLAETNATFRKMLVGMTEGGAWLQVALVTGTTVSKCYQSHAQYALVAAPEREREDGDDGLAGVPVAA